MTPRPTGGVETVAAGPLVVELSGVAPPFGASLGVEAVGEGVYHLAVRLESPAPAPPPPIELAWSVPIVDVAGAWRPTAGRDRGLGVDWGRGWTSKATSSAPVGCLFDLSGGNRLTFALSDALNPMRITAGVREETATYRCAIAFFSDAPAFGPPPFGPRTPSLPPLARYEATLRLDLRAVPYHEALADVAARWASLPGYRPAAVPETARLPMYSTWYAFHQQLAPAEIEEQCRLAKRVGCDAVIVDDGWQTTSNERGYAHAGDWRPAPEKIPEMRAHVDRVHDLGLKYLLWYAVPFVGVHSEAYARFRDRLLGEIGPLGAGVLDPRYPEVREYLIGTYEAAVRDWGLDGLKLDFVDSFGPLPVPPPGGSATAETAAPRTVDGRDTESVYEAVDRLMKGALDRLRALDPEIMIEFRQSYVGPLMRTYGNMFRAGDCPNDAVENRIRTLDIRLLAGGTATHSDMLMWHADEPVESAALQLVNALFSVPQISVRLDRIPDEHTEMLRFWLGFWRDHRGVLLDGWLAPQDPLGLYPAVLAGDEGTTLAAVYADTVARIGGAAPPRLVLVNGTRRTGLALELGEGLGARTLVIHDCRGREVEAREVALDAGLHRLAVPPAGVAELRAIGDEENGPEE